MGGGGAGGGSGAAGGGKGSRARAELERAGGWRQGSAAVGPSRRGSARRLSLATPPPIRPAPLPSHLPRPAAQPPRRLAGSTCFRRFLARSRSEMDMSSLPLAPPPSLSSERSAFMWLAADSSRCSFLSVCPRQGSQA